MQAAIEKALREERVIDITTMGRKTNQPRRIEIWFHHIEGQLYITGRPGKRNWYANLLHNPSFTFHLKQSVKADIPATAEAITDEDTKHEILAKLLPTLNFDSYVLEEWVDKSPLVAVTLHFSE